MKSEKRKLKKNVLFLVLLLLGGLPLFSQNVNVTGVVTDEKGDPLVGVSVVLKNTTNGTLTDIDGAYSLSNIEIGKSVLNFSFIGYDPISIEIKENKPYNVRLREDRRILDEVVVVAYGVQKKANLTGAVSSVKIDDVADIPVSNTAALLQGRMSGVTVSSFSSQPGKDDDVEIRIRGLSTFGNNKPLILIDGVEGSMSSVAPNDIESISVLKDAASAAIYGVRAASGVILITTKSGIHGESKLSYNGSYGIQSATVLPKYVNSWQWATLYNEENIVKGNPGMNYTPAMIQALKDGSDPDHFANTNWSDEIFRTGHIQTHHLSMTGSGSNSKYLGSIGWMEQEGILIGTRTTRSNFRLNADTKYINMITLGLNTSGSYQKTTEPVASAYGVFETMGQHGHPSVPVKYSNGNWGFFDGNNERSSRNPVFEASMPMNTKVNRFDGKVYADVEPIANLHFRTSFAYQYDSWTSRKFKPVYKELKADGTAKGAGNPVSTLDENYYYGTQWINENIITYATKFNSNSLNFLLGQSNQFNGYRHSWAYGENFPSNDVQVLNAALSSNAGGLAEEATLRSFFGRINYNYDDRYMAEVNLRRDETSRIPKKNRVGYFPSFSAGWNIAQESFMKNVTILDALKLRASWGQLGNQEIGYYPYAQYYQINSNYVWDGVKVPGISMMTLGNPDLKWETTTSTNIGVDVTLLNNKITFTGEYFVKNTDDILMQLPIPGIVGVKDAPYVNAASVRNTGWEFDLGYNDKWGDFTFGAKLNLSTVKNKITHINGNQPWISASTINMVGHPIGSFYGYIANGLYKDQAEVDAANSGLNTIGGGVVGLGDVKLVNINGDNVIDIDDRTIIGNPFPDLTYALNITSAFKGFDLSLFFQGVSGIDRFSVEYPIVQGMVTTKMWDRYSPVDNPQGAYPRLGNGGYNATLSSFWIEDASYLRLKNIELGYSFSGSWMKKMKLEKLRVYMNAQNILTFTGLDNYDPEKAGGDTRNYSYPNAKTVSFGLNITL